MQVVNWLKFVRIAFLCPKGSFMEMYHSLAIRNWCVLLSRFDYGNVMNCLKFAKLLSLLEKILQLCGTNLDSVNIAAFIVCLTLQNLVVNGISIKLVGQWG